MTKSKQPNETKADLMTLFNQMGMLFEEVLVNKAPSIPKDTKEIIVKYAPYISLAIIFFSLPAIIFALGLGTLLSPFAFWGGARYGFSFSPVSLLLFATIILEIMALPGLFSRKINGWDKTYYATLLSAVYSLLNFQLGSMIFGTAISLYILFQVKSYYK